MGLKGTARRWAGCWEGYGGADERVQRGHPEEHRLERTDGTGRPGSSGRGSGPPGGNGVLPQEGNPHRRRGLPRHDLYGDGSSPGPLPPFPGTRLLSVGE